jgi:hypothetical protein
MVLMMASRKNFVRLEIRYLVQIDDLNTPDNTFTHSSFFTRMPAVFAFTAEQCGKFFCARMRWENTTGKKSPLSEILCVRIP